MKLHHRAALIIGCATIFLLPVLGECQIFGRVIRNMGGAGMVPMPYSVPDSAGNQWMIYPGGWLQLQGNQPLYSQGGMILINGQQPGVRSNQARLDDKTGEVVFENLNVSGFNITRRVLVNKEESYVRYVDIIKNPQAADQNVNVQVQSNLNFGIDQGTPIADPRKKDNNIGFTTTNGNGKSIVEMYAGKGSKLAPNVTYQQGNTQVQASLQVTIPGNKEVAIVHIHGVTGTPEQGTQFVQNFKESKLLASLSSDLRKSIVNFSGGQGFIGERELLRGDVFDVVEIRGGDQMRGTIKEPSFKLATFYGNVELPASRVVGIINVGEFRPRQLLVTTDGEIFGGRLSKETLPLELTTGQLTQIPLSQVTRAGYRKRADEPEEWTFDKPFVSLRTGERVGVTMPTIPIDVVTRYGPLKLDAKNIATIVFQTEEHGVHEIYLTDGSKIAGLVSSPEFEMKLSGGSSPSSTTQPAESSSTSGQVVHFPSSAISRIQFTGPPVDADDSSATLSLTNDDTLVGSLAGQLKLDTAFDTLTLDAGQIRKMSRGKDGGATDVQVTLWDQTVVSGQLEDPAVKCALDSGVTIQVPVALIQDYNQPQPTPASGMVDKIKSNVAQLNADDWKTRDRAEAELTAMGPAVVSVLKQLRPTQPPEAQQRIDQILASVAKKK